MKSMFVSVAGLIAAFSASAGLAQDPNVPTVRPSQVQAAFAADENSGERIDYVTFIQHGDGRITRIQDYRDYRAVYSDDGTPQTLGRGGTHLDVIRTHFRPSQGDKILSIGRFDSANRRTTLYDRRYEQERKERARASAFALQQQAQSRAIYEADLERADQARRQQEARERRDREDRAESHGGASHDFDRGGGVDSGGRAEAIGLDKEMTIDR